MDPTELASMVSDVRFAEAALGAGRKRPSPDEDDNRRIGRRSFVAAQAIRAGTAVTDDLLAVKRPGFGIPPAMHDAIVGRVARRDIEPDEVLTWDMF
jgi:sialic acid synthase SpsE